MTDPAALGAALDRLLAGVDLQARLAADPILAPRRYTHLHDVEVAAVFAATLAFGRVASFLPVLEALMARADAQGGPGAWAQAMGPAEAAALAPRYYRWLKGEDFALLAATLGAAQLRFGSVGALFERAFSPAHPHIGPALDAGINDLRAIAADLAPGLLGHPAGAPLPRGFRVMLTRPADGSANKRWCMLMRWMCRAPSLPGADLGRWAIPPSHLIMPLDTHVHALGRLLGLTDRADGSWKTAVALTAALRAFQPHDPLRYDFALAHLGISGACVHAFDPRRCPACPLQGVCAAGLC
jgi:uncharacterized protein (TIGR02757 family)